MNKDLSLQSPASEHTLMMSAEKIIQSANIMVVCLDLEGKVILFNETAEKITGYKKSEILGQDWFERIAPRDRYPETWKVFEEFKKKRGSIIGDFENPILTKDGKERIIQWKNSDFYDDGHVVGIISYGIDVTMNKEDIERLIKLSSFPELNPYPVVEFDVTGTLHYVNPSAKKIFSDLELLKFQHPFLLGAEELIARKKEQEQAVVMRDILANEHWYQQVLTKVPNSSLFRLYCVDVTEPYNFKKILQESEERFRGMMEQSILSIQILAPDGKTIQVNHAFEELWGVAMKDLEKYNILKDVQLERLGILPYIQRAFSGEKSAIPAAEYDTKESLGIGKKKWVQAYIYPVKNRENVIREVIIIHEDITKQKQAEQEIIRVNRALRMVSDINQALIHSADEAMILQRACDIAVSVGGYRLAWIGFGEDDEKKSVRIVAFAGFNAEYISSSAITWADSERGRGPTGTAIRTGKTVVSSDIGQDSSMAPWREAALKHGYRSLVAIPLRSKEQTFGVLNIYATETNAFHNEELAIMEELAGDLAFGITTLRMHGEVEARTKEIDQLKNKFIQIVSHQLRTPLSVIRWNLETLLEHKRGETTAAQEEILHGTYAACTEVVSRIGDLTTAMDIEEHRLLLDLSFVDGDDVIRSATKRALEASILKQITSEIILPKEPLPSIQADAGKIREVITRLVDNAITYTKNDGHITVSFFLKDGHIRFEITDTGIGIPASEQKHIFERFFRGSNASLMKTDASGLSLFICRSYIQAHHGTIGFLSTSENGTTFWFELPVT